MVPLAHLHVLGVRVGGRRGLRRLSDRGGGHGSDKRDHFKAPEITSWFVKSQADRGGGVAISARWPRWNDGTANTGGATWTIFSAIGAAGTTATAMHIDVQQIFAGALSWWPRSVGMLLQ